MKPIPKGMAIDIVLVDDHPVTRFALKLLLEQQPGWRVSRQCESPAQVISLLREREPHVLIIDLLFAGESGLELLEHVKAFAPAVRTVVYSMRSQEHYAQRCRKAGAMAYVCKDAPLADVVDAVNTVLLGRHYTAQEAAAAAAAAADNGEWSGADSAVSTLSNRELEVLQYLGQGLGTQQIAKAICRSVKTVETYRWRIRKKLGLQTSQQLLQYAVLYVEQTAGAA